MVLTLAYGVVPAYAWVALTWIDSATFAAFAADGTNGYTSREYIEAWRPAGTEIRLCYWHTNSSIKCSGYSTDNPFKWSVSDGYAKALCQSEILQFVSPMTCQTTEPN